MKQDNLFHWPPRQMRRDAARVSRAKGRTRRRRKALARIGRVVVRYYAKTP